MAKHLDNIKLSAWQFAQHIGVTTNKIKGAIKANGVEPLERDLYTLRDLVRAYASPSGLKARAEDARYEKQIAEAKAAENKVAAFQRDYVPRKEYTDMFEDLQATLVQIIRHTKMTEQAKTLAINQIRQAKVE